MKFNAIKIIVVLALISFLNARPLAEPENNSLEITCEYNEGVYHCVDDGKDEDEDEDDEEEE